MDLNAIRERCEKATPGEWEADHESDHGRIVFIWGGNGGGQCVFRPSIDVVRGELCCEIQGGNLEDDLAFIAHARTDVPALLDYVEELKAKLERAVKYVDADIDVSAPHGPCNSCGAIDCEQGCERAAILRENGRS